MGDDNDLEGTFTFNEELNPKLSFDKFPTSEYVACYYDNNWWIRLVQNVNYDEKDVEINFLHPPGTSGSFTWPQRKYFFLGSICEYDM